MKKNGNKVSILKYVIISIVIFGGSVLISEITRAVLIGNIWGIEFSDVAADLVASLLQGAVGAIAAGFVLYQLKLGDATEERQSDIAEAEFILHYNQAFVGDVNMCAIEHMLEEKMESGKPVIINSENRQAIVNYLVYLEGLAPLVFRNVLRLDHIDDLMAYRFFLAMNNPELQEDQLFRYPDYFRGCFKLYERWKEYRIKNGYPILQAQTALDKWPFYDLYAEPEITVRPYKENDNKQVIAELIYDTDPYIYPSAFGEKADLKKNLAKLLVRKGLFSAEHITLAFKDKKIIGILLFVGKEDDLNIDINGLWLPDSFDDVNEKYFGEISNTVKDNSKYIACVSVDKKYRDQGVGEALLRYVIRDNPMSVLKLDVLDDNNGALKLYGKYLFNQHGEIRNGYSYDGNPPMCREMIYIPKKKSWRKNDE